MDSPKENIDHLLSEILSDTKMSAEGIDWNAFQAKRKRKRVIIWWFTGVGGVLCILLVGLLSGVWKSPSAQDQVVEKPVAQHNLPQSSTTESKQNNQSVEQEILIPDERDSAEVDRNAQLRKELSSKPKNGKTISRVKTQITETNRTNEKQTDADQKPKSVFPIFQLIPVGYPYLHISAYPALRADSIVTALRKVDFPASKSTPNILKVGIGPTLVNPSLSGTSEGESLIHKDYVSIRNAAEQNAVGFHLSAMIGKQYGKFTPYVGFGFSHNAVLAKYNFTYSEKPIQDLNGTILGYQKRAPEQVKYASDQSYSLVDIPIGLEYTFKSNQKHTWNVVGQMSPQILVSAQGNLPNAVLLNQKDILTMADYKLNTITGQIGFNYTREMGNMQWYIEPKVARKVGLTQVKSLYETRFNMIVVTFGIKK